MTGALKNNDSTLKLWDLASGAQLDTFARHQEGVTSVAFSPDRVQVLSGIRLGTPWQVLSGTTRRTLELRATATGELLRTFKGNSEGVALVAFSSDRRQVLLSDGVDTFKLRDAVTGALLRTFTHSGWIESVAFSPDGLQVLSGSTDGTLKLWDAASGAPLRTIRAHSEGVTSVAFSPDGRRVLSGSRGSFEGEDDTLKLWDAASGALLRTMAGSRNQADSVAFSPDGRLVLAGGLKQFWRPFRNDAIATLELWDATTGALLRTFKGHSRGITAVAFSPNGRQVLSGSNDKTLRLWDATEGALLRTFTGHSESVTSAAFSSDGRQVLSGSADKTLKLWDAASGALLRTFEGHSDRVSSVAFSADGRQVISVGLNGITGIWNRATGELVANSLATPQGEWLAMTPAGFIASSRSVSDLLSIVRGLNVITIDQVHQSLFNPDLVREALAGDPEGEVAKAAKVMNLEKVLDSGPAPSVQLMYPTDSRHIDYPPFRGDKGNQSDTELIAATALVEDRGTGVGRIEWRVNGITAAVAVGPPPDQQGPVYRIQQKLALDPGNNIVEVIAYNRRNLLASLPARTTVHFTGPAEEIRPKLHILAIGVNRYVDEKFAPPLDLAEQDAKAFANSMKKAAGGLYGEVRVAQVLGGQATLANLTGVVDRIAADIHPRDTFILFAAGHGVSSNGRFYLIPQNYRSGAASLVDGAIGQDQLQDWLANRIKAKRALILLDTCESGALIAGHTSSRVDAPASEAAVGRLHEATGRPVLTAAAKGQSAWEPGGRASGENHSVFTWALLDALRKADTNGNGLIELSELVGHVQSVVPRIAAGIGSGPTDGSLRLAWRGLRCGAAFAVEE
jgi:WD40 repeat protein